MLDVDLLSIQEARSLVRSAHEAGVEFSTLNQEGVDQIVAAISKRAVRESETLAKMAVEETGFGRWQDKKEKNLLASETIWNHIKDMKTIGVINEDREKKIVEIATPVGVIGALIPSTNPTSTTIYKAMISLKAGNAVVFSPHPSALGCITATVNMIQEVLESFKVSKHMVSVMCYPSMEGTAELMKISDLILATGGPAMVKAAYSSGTPALGVGAGNVPVFIERSAVIEDAIDKIMTSKTFDNGTVCASEQAIITEHIIEEQVKSVFMEKGGYFLKGEKLEKVRGIMERPDGSMNPRIVGRTADQIATMAGIDIPAGTRVLACEEKGVGPGYPFSKEKLTALIGFYSVKDWKDACKLCFKLLENGGLGHSMAIHSRDETVIREFAMKKPVSRVLVNTPSTHGAVGLSTNLAPSLTLGCGTIGGSATSDNVEASHLYNIRKLAYGIEPETSRAPDDPSVDPSIDVKRITDLIMETLSAQL